MVTSVRAKLKIDWISEANPNFGPEQSRNVRLDAVYAGDDELAKLSENARFWSATPCGQFSMSIQNPTAIEFFEKNMGREVYCDITIAPRFNEAQINYLKAKVAEIDADLANPAFNDYASKYYGGRDAAERMCGYYKGLLANA